jgi:hypothetical protein
LQDRKGRKPYRTAPAQKNLAKNATTIGSRLRDIRHGSGGAGTMFCARGNANAGKAKRAEGHARLTGHAAVGHRPICTLAGYESFRSGIL